MQRWVRLIPFVFLVGFLASCGRPNVDKGDTVYDADNIGIKVGQNAPDFEGKDLHGREHRLSDYKGKVVLLQFWSVNCPYCHVLAPFERMLVDRMKGKPFAMLGVSCDRSRDDADRMAYQLGMNWPSLWDGAPGPVAMRYEVEYFPTIYILDHEGVIQYRSVTDEKSIEKAVTELVAAAEKAKKPA